MKKYIIVKKEVIEKIWKIEVETYNKAVDCFATIKDSSMLPADILKEYADWQVYEEIDMESGIKKYTLKEK